MDGAEVGVEQVVWRLMEAAEGRMTWMVMGVAWRESSMEGDGGGMVSSK